MIVIELTAAINAGGTLKTFYVSTDAYATKAADTPANTAFEPTVKDPGTITSTVYGDGQVIGSTKLTVGEVVLSNANGQYDAWLTYGFDGRPVTIRQGDIGAAYPAGFAVIAVGVVSNISADRKELRVRIKDRQYIFDRPVLTTVYAGNNALPSGAEGVAADIKGKVKPRVYGQVFNAAVPCVNTSKLTYQINDGAITSIDAVYDRGVALTNAGNFTTLANLEAASPAGGTFVTCLPLGLLRLGSAPAGVVTVDATQGANASDRTVAQTLRNLALAAGVVTGDIDATAIAALDTLNASTVGIYLDSETTFIEAMDMVAKSLSVFYGFNNAGKFTASQWTAPAGTSLVTIGEFYAGKDTERRPLKDINVPVWQVRLTYAKNYTVQTNDLAGSVSQARRGVIGLPNASQTVSDAAILTQFLLATVLEVDTVLTGASAAATEAARLLTMHKVQRDAFEVPVPLSLVGSAVLALGACVTLQIGRFGLVGGKLMRIQAIRLELAKNRAMITVWG